MNSLPACNSYCHHDAKKCDISDIARVSDCFYVLKEKNFFLIAIKYRKISIVQFEKKF